MKYLILVLTLMSAGCTSNTQFGKCIGLNGDKQPNLVYEYSTNNIVWGLLGTQFFLIPPAIVLLKELECPIGVK